jgi:23S rRNA (pseudouridine1915-N3)-methyltransferase
MNIKILLEGKIKEPYFKLGIDEFKKRLTGYTSLKIIETDSILNFAQTNIKQNSYLITLEIEGKSLSSPEFAQKIKEIEQDGGYNEIIFAIGGSNGLPDEIRNKSNFKFSMSKLTFLHQEAVFILIEQIYRAYKILNNETYHK